LDGYPPPGIGAGLRNRKTVWRRTINRKKELIKKSSFTVGPSRKSRDPTQGEELHPQDLDFLPHRP